MTQLSLFDALRAPPIIRPVQPRGHVLQEEPEYTLVLPSQGKRVWPNACIEIHPTADGLWMWSTSFNTGTTGSTYRVGEKWGHFARSRDDALHYAIEEMRSRVMGLQACDKHARPILVWLDEIAGFLS
jgi:hypothetical protein